MHKCPHDCDVNLKTHDNGKSPIGVFKCPKCHCIFRMIGENLVLVNRDSKCLPNRKVYKGRN